MRVLHIITGLASGGAELQLRLLLRNMPPEVQSEVLTLENPGLVAQGIERDGVRVTHLGMRGNRDIPALYKISKFIRQGNFDIVHTHLYRACVYGRLAARLAGVRNIVATEHSLLDSSLEGRTITGGVKALYKLTEHLGKHTVAVSRAVEGRLQAWGIPERKIRTIPNGIDAAHFSMSEQERAFAARAVREELGIPLDAYVVGGVGRLVPGKRFDVLIDALAQMPETPGGRVPWLLLVGDGASRGTLQQQAAELGVVDRTVFAGERADVRRLLAAMDVFAAPSVVETFGLALLEALAAGLPVLYSSGPALEELPSAEAPQAHAEASDGRSYAQRLGDLSLNSQCLPFPPPGAVHRYDIVEVVGQLTALYLEMVGPWTRAPEAVSPSLRSSAAPVSPAPVSPAPVSPAPGQPAPHR
ncbi:glycosyltransferase [Kitasatospora sp. NPDC088346]|uniref:glycosyltransferase n=1 Tax=Kitasatospora sp. NPDC088346 TaxID=3364073 RepID=UPI0037F40262